MDLEWDSSLGTFVVVDEDGEVIGLVECLPARVVSRRRDRRRGR
jgi:hypothetical protein